MFSYTLTILLNGLAAHIISLSYIYVYKALHYLFYYGQDEIRTHKMMNIRRLAIGYTSPVAACPVPIPIYSYTSSAPLTINRI